MAKLKTKDVAVLSHNQSYNSSLFQSQILGFGDATVMRIINIVILIIKEPHWKVNYRMRMPKI